ncbi:MAG: amidinotransferase [Bacteroidetes bacterium]|nr:MAG: amidinotransferase [Bacteroidota bacterium]
MQTTSHILMIKPVNFSFNAETAVNNAFQVAGEDEGAQEKALDEFEDFVLKLSDSGIDVTVVDDTPFPYTPDSIFPNNWISFHEDGSIFLYPMYADNRRLERKDSVLESVEKKFEIRKTVDLSGFEKENQFLEGTGSMVLDRDHKIAYACLSPRTSETVLKKFCEASGYKAVVFNSVDQNGKAIYHTNVMMCVGDQFVVICMDSIPDQKEKLLVREAIRESGKELIEITLDQMNHFAGNMLQVQNKSGEKFLVMSTQAFHSLNKDQIKKLEIYNPIIHSSLQTIETNGGGSARCMMAEVYLPVKD